MDNILKVLGNILGNWQPKGQYSYNFRSPAAAAQPTTAPTMAPSPTAAPTAPPPGNFKFDMGKNDYAYLKPYLDKILQNTPLAPYENDFIKAGNQYGIDPRVLPTIANSESSLGKKYPTDTHNPFGYIVLPNGQHPQNYQQIVQGLQGAGFTSLPMAIDRLTGRFQRQPTAGYQQFYKDPTIQNLQGAYNATPDEAANWIKNAQALLKQ